MLDVFVFRDDRRSYMRPASFSAKGSHLQRDKSAYGIEFSLIPTRDENDSTSNFKEIWH